MTRGLVDPEQVRRVSRTMALRKVAQPEDVARQVVVLASDELSGHVTGQVVTVAGGMEGRIASRRSLKESGGWPPPTSATGDCRQSPTRLRSPHELIAVQSRNEEGLHRLGLI